MNQKGNVLLIVLIIAAAIGGYLIYSGKFLNKPEVIYPQQTTQPSPSDETANWKTYTYPEFSFKLPRNWKIDKSSQVWKTDNSSNYLQFTNYAVPAIGRGFNPELDKGKLKLEIIGDKTNQSIENYFAKSLEGSGIKDWNEEKLTVGGQPAIRIRTNQPGFNKVYIKDLTQTTLIIISFNLDFGNFSDLSNQILSTFKFLDQNKAADVSLAKDREMPSDIQKTLPTKSLDGKDIVSFYISDNTDYLVFETFVKEAGAGNEYDLWLLNRITKVQLNLSNLIRKDINYQKTYNNIINYENLFLAFDDRWIDDNPVFSVVDGWQVVGEFWEYDIANNKFVYIPNQ